MNLEQAFGEILQQERGRARISQARLAELSDLDINTISLYERGLMQPTLKTVFKIAEGLGVEPDDLICWAKENFDRQNQTP